jgi:hypothetical protein
MSKKQITLHQNLPLIEVANPILLDTLLSDKRTTHMILKRLDERVAIVVPGQFDTLLSRLKKLGHLPKITSTAND